MKVFKYITSSIAYLSIFKGKNSISGTKDRPLVLLISLFFPPEIGGGSTGAWNRATAFSMMGFRVFVLAGFPQFRGTYGQDPRYQKKPFLYLEKMDDITVIRVKSLGLKYEGVVKRLIIFLSFCFSALLCLPRVFMIMKHIDIVYARAPIIFSSIPGFIFSKFAKCIYIYEAPDLWPDELANIKSPFVPFLMRFGKLAAKISYMSPDIIVTTSTAQEERIRRQYAPRVNVYAIPVGVDEKSFSNLPKEKCRREMIEIGVLPEGLESKFIILYSGLLSAAQQVDNLVFAARKLKNDTEIAIILLGDGPEKPNLLHMKEIYEINNLYFIPVQPRNLMQKIISSVDLCAILLAPDPIFDIVLPTKFYEYLACCKPVIGVCRGELAAIIESYGIGLVTDARDVNKIASDIRMLKSSPLLLNGMQKKCIEALGQFNLDSIASRLAAILKAEGVFYSAAPQQ